MKKHVSEIECLVCNGTHFRKGYFVANYEKFDEKIKWNVKTDAGVLIYLESEEDNPLNRIPEKVNLFSYICEECGYIMNFTKEKQVESKKLERIRKQRQTMYDWTKFK
ncbi:hypothetical protein ACIFOT_29930 [Neobacillus sp. NRS-1170]|uniref:hypothetical protein n=1 Tax=Neobacillus sp. NRS-1170 TaxID=3233898 RepID=UPI003D266066